jgi:hypothetical protein
MDAHDITALMAGIAPVIHAEIEALQKQIAALTARVAELESGSMKYCGVHQASMAYRKGHVVTFDGAAWCATRDVSVEKPGHGDGWQLMVKAARDATPRADASATASPRNGSSHSMSNPRFK